MLWGALSGFNVTRYRVYICLPSPLEVVEYYYYYYFFTMQYSYPIETHIETSLQLKRYF